MDGPYFLFQSELKHGVSGLRSLFTFKQASRQLQQIRKRNQCKNTFQLNNRVNFLWLIQGSAYWYKFSKANDEIVQAIHFISQRIIGFP